MRGLWPSNESERLAEFKNWWIWQHPCLILATSGIILLIVFHYKI